MTRRAKASSAGSTQGQAGRLGSIRRALATRAASFGAKGTGAPSSRRPRLLLGLGVALLASLVLGVALASATAPTVSVEDASSVSYLTAKVKGTVDPQGQPTTYRFQYISEEAFQVHADAQQTLVVSGEEGAFTLTFQGQATPALPFNASAAEVQTALDALATIGGVGGSVAVSGGPGNAQGTFPYLITFGGSLAETSVGQIESSGSVYTTIQTTRPGHHPGFGGAVIAKEETIEGAEQTVEAALSGLTQNTTYHLRLLAENADSAGTPSEAIAVHTFTTKEVAKPTVTIDPVTTFTATTAHFSGHVDPNSPEHEGSTSPAEEEAFKTSWHFQCSPGCSVSGGELVADNTAHEVTAEATGLTPGTPYEVTLVATNAAGPETAGPVSFATKAVAPVVDSTSISEVGTTEATLGAQVNPGGAPTTYHFEYLTQAAYEANGNSFSGSEPATSVPQPDAALGFSDNADHPATAELTGLAPETNYDYRVVATNSAAPAGAASPARVFATTSTAPASSGCSNEALREENNSMALPDCRAYEQVSAGGSEVRNDSWRVTRAAADGGAVAYIADPAQAGGFSQIGSPLGTQWLSRRSAGGWAPAPINPERLTSYYQAFSPDLSLGIVNSGFSQPPLTADAPAGRSMSYARNSDGSYEPLVTKAELPPGTPFFEHAYFGAEGQREHPGLEFAGASADGSHRLFEANAALTTVALKHPPSYEENDLYDSVAGELRLVNVLPGAEEEPAPNADFGGRPAVVETEGGQTSNAVSANFSNVISADGSRIFWTDLDTGRVYERVNGTATVAVSQGPAEYWGASSDGHYAFYTEGEAFFRFDTQTETRQELADAASGVKGVAAISEDGSYVYLVAGGGGSLPAPEGTPGSCSSGGAGEGNGHVPPGHACNLYLLHSGEPPRLIASLSIMDNQLESDGLLRNGDIHAGDWTRSLATRVAEVSADGHSLVFESTQDLTGYDLGAATSHGTNSEGTLEVFVYDADTGRLSCASCDPTGATLQPGGRPFLPFSVAPTYQHRWISEHGDRVFFESRGQVNEWEREGSGPSCPARTPARPDGGCVFLLSGPGGSSLFLDASASGNDVFFMTLNQLTLGDRDEKIDLYDARVNGGFPAPAEPPACESPERCHSQGTPEPQSSSPGTATFQAPPERVCRKGLVEKHGSCVKPRSKKHHKKRPHKKSHSRHANANGGGSK